MLATSHARVAARRVIDLTSENLLLGRMRHHDAKAVEKRRRPGTVRQRRQRLAHVVLADGEPCAERVRIHADALEFAKQLLESLFLGHSALAERGPKAAFGHARYDESAEQTAYPDASWE